MKKNLDKFLGPSIHGLVTDIEVNVYIGNFLLRLALSKLTYVEDEIIISPLFLCISVIFLQKARVQYTILNVSEKLPVNHIHLT